MPGLRIDVRHWLSGRSIKAANDRLHVDCLPWSSAVDPAKPSDIREAEIIGRRCNDWKSPVIGAANIRVFNAHEKRCRRSISSNGSRWPGFIPFLTMSGALPCVNMANKLIRENYIYSHSRRFVEREGSAFRIARSEVRVHIVNQRVV